MLYNKQEIITLTNNMQFETKDILTEEDCLKFAEKYKTIYMEYQQTQNPLMSFFIEVIQRLDKFKELIIEQKNDYRLILGEFKRWFNNSLITLLAEG